MASSADAAESIADRGLAALGDTLEYVQGGVATKLYSCLRLDLDHLTPCFPASQPHAAAAHTQCD